MLTMATDPQTLMRRMEHLSNLALQIAVKANDANDARLVLQGIDRANTSLQTLMKATGLFSDGTTIVVNAERQKRMTQSEALQVLLECIPAREDRTALLNWLRGASPSLPKTIALTGETDA